MKITTDVIKQLRDQAGVSVMQCKQALEEAGGDVAAALVILRKKSGAFAEKKSLRELKAGVVAAYIHAGGAVGSMVEVLCESDFVSRNDAFKVLAYDIAMQIAATNPSHLSFDDIPEEAKEQARVVFMKEIDGKPEHIKEQIMDGKLRSYFLDKTLLDQSFIKDESQTVRGLVDAAVQKFGEKIEIGRFVRFSILGR